jgi:glutamine synthetase
MLDSPEAGDDCLLEGGVFTPDLIETSLDYRRFTEFDALGLRPRGA